MLKEWQEEARPVFAYHFRYSSRSNTSNVDRRTGRVTKQVQRRPTSKRASRAAQRYVRRAAYPYLRRESACGLDGIQDEIPLERQKGKAGHVNVAERVKQLQQRDVKPALPHAATFKQLTYGSSGKLPASTKAEKGPPIVFPLHVKRFIRRDSNASAVRPETPLYRAEPSDDAYLHAPTPEKKSAPSIAQSDESALALDTSRGDHDPFMIHSGFGKRPTMNFAVRRTSRPHEHGKGRVSPARTTGTTAMCMRHGRRLQPSKSKPELTRPTQDMVERSRSGAYIPTGQIRRTQHEATSPWAVLTTKSDPSLNASICPDCVAEQRIKRRETLEAREGTEDTVRRPQNDRSLLDDEENDLLPAGRSSLVVARDLRQAINAVIFEREGELERVITNISRGQPTRDALLKLAEDLETVSKTLAHADASLSSSPLRRKGECRDRAVILDTSAEMLRKRARSVPGLLHLIDEAASGLDLDVGQKAREPIERRDFARTKTDDSTSPQQSLLGSADEHFLRSPASYDWSSTRHGSVESDYQTLHQQFGVSHNDEENAVQEAASQGSYGQPSATPLPFDVAISPSTLSSAYLQTAGASPASSDRTLQGDRRPSLLPSELLRANDFSPGPPSVLSEQGSLAYFDTMTSPYSVSTPLSYLGTIDTPSAPSKLPRFTRPTAKDISPVSPSPSPRKPPLTPSSAKAEAQIIREAMRMDRQKAVQEATAVERTLRRKKYMGSRLMKDA